MTMEEIDAVLWYGKSTPSGMAKESGNELFYIKAMTTINAPAYKGNLLEVFENVAMYSDTINVWTEKGNAVIISEEEYRDIMETLHIASTPQMKEKIIEGLKTPLSECLSEEEVNF